MFRLYYYSLTIQYNKNLHRIYIVLRIISNLELLKINGDICRLYVKELSVGFGICAGTWCPKTNPLSDTEECVYCQNKK